MIYAIGDLHLSTGMKKKKPMDKFGKNWQNHQQKLEQNWQSIITKDDTVLLCGDISWAMNENDFLPDLQFIHNLNGKKIIISGNHDFWWGSTSKLNSFYEDIKFLKNDFLEVENYYICGAKGWTCPNDSLFTNHDEKIYNREITRLKVSLDIASAKGDKEIIAMLHFPPFNDKKELSEVVNLLQNYNIKKVVYGHLHGYCFKNSINGEKFGLNFNLVSADFLNFAPLKLL